MDALYTLFPVSGVKTWVFLPSPRRPRRFYLYVHGRRVRPFSFSPFQIGFLGFTSPAVSSTNFVYNIVAIPSGVYKYFKEGRMARPLPWVVIAGTLPGVFIGYYLRIFYLPDPRAFKLFAGCVLLYLGVRLLYGRRAGLGKQGPAERTGKEVRPRGQGSEGPAKLPRGRGAAARRRGQDRELHPRAPSSASSGESASGSAYRPCSRLLCRERRRHPTASAEGHHRPFCVAVFHLRSTPWQARRSWGPSSTSIVRGYFLQRAAGGKRHLNGAGLGAGIPLRRRRVRRGCTSGPVSRNTSPEGHQTPARGHDPVLALRYINRYFV